MLLEPNGFLATDPATLRGLSQRGVAVAVYTSVNVDASFQYARNGVLLRSFDPLLYTDTVGRPLPQEQGIAFGRVDGAQFLVRSLSAAERLTGLRIDPSDLRPEAYRIAVGVTY